MIGSQTTGDIRKGSRRDPGRVMVWLCGSALAFNILMVAGILGILLYEGSGAFWPRKLVLVTLENGRRLLGEVHDEEEVYLLREDDAAAPERVATRRLRMKVGNRELVGQDFAWVDETDIHERSWPEDAAVLERLEWGNFYGWPVELRRKRDGAEDELLARGRGESWRVLLELLPEKHALRRRIKSLEKDEIGDCNHAIEELRLEKLRVEYQELPEAAERERLEAIERELEEWTRRYEDYARRLDRLRDEAAAEVAVMETAGGRRHEVPVSEVVRAIRPNALDTFGSLSVYASRIGEFLLDEPRESNTEGGIFPAIFGTVMMVFLMTFFVLPLGVLAALYLREYAGDGFLVRAVRIAVNNLAGVPSIVFGIFGLGFFVYLVGGTIDRLFYPESLPAPTFGTGGILWASLTLALLTLPVVIVATEEGLAAVPRALREGSLALGATKWETTYRVVLPAAAPGVLTGMILAMARAAGEVAPLMLVGMMKLAPALPIDGRFPYVHLDRKFMHLGFHIYDVGFQSPNVEAAKPLVFATALLLVLLVLLMNLTAISVRNHLRRKYASSTV